MAGRAGGGLTHDQGSVGVPEHHGVRRATDVGGGQPGGEAVQSRAPACASSGRATDWLLSKEDTDNWGAL